METLLKPTQRIHLTAENERLINEDLHAIYNSLTDHNNFYIVDHPSLLGGKTGTILFLFYYGRHFNSTEAIQKAFSYLEEILEKTDTLNDTTLGSGYFGVGWTLSNLNRIGIVEDSDLAILGPINALVSGAIESAYDAKNYDLFYGLIGIGQYVLENEAFPNRKSILETICDRLISLSVKHQTGITWPNYFSVTRPTPIDHGYDLGLAHGIPGIIAFFCQLFQNGIRQDEIAKIIPPAVHWLMKEEKPVDGCSFNHKFVNTNDGGWSRIAWCNGDLSVGICLLHLHQTFDNKKYLDDAVRIALKTTARNHEHSGIAYSIENNFVDACFCHGVSGLSLIYKIFFLTTGKEAFKNCENSLMDFLFQHLNRKLPLAGYMKYLEDTDDGSKYTSGDASLIEGLAGIGLSYLSLVSGKSLEWQRLFLLNL